MVAISPLRLCSLKLVFVNHNAHAAAATIFEAAHDPAPAIDLHILPRAHDFGRSRIVKSTIEPTGTSLSMANSTPLAEMFSVSAENALPCDFTEADRCSGNRGALCMSS